MKMLIAGKNYKSVPIDDHFFCGVCGGVADDPKKCQSCEDVFCDTCIQETKKKSNECPACKKQPFKDIQLSRYERIKLNEA
jgi:20S proteasome alpha/beta subunit